MTANYTNGRADLQPLGQTPIDRLHKRQLAMRVESIRTDAEIEAAYAAAMREKARARNAG